MKRFGLVRVLLFSNLLYKESSRVPCCLCPCMWTKCIASREEEKVRGQCITFSLTRLVKHDESHLVTRYMSNLEVL